MTRVAILGCGYVGCELARQLQPDHDVIGVRRSESGLRAVEDTGATAVKADVTEPDALAAVPDADWVIFAASSGGRGADAARETYVGGLRTTIDHFCGREAVPDRIVYTSSTGVYGDHDGDWVDEAMSIDPGTERGQALAEAEAIARQRPIDDTDGTVARFAGLYGPDRYRLQRYLDGPVTEGHLNMVHRDDAAGAVRFLLEGDHARREVVNVVDDEPVEKWAFADWLAEQCGEPEPPKQTVADRLDDPELSEAARNWVGADKRVSNEKLRGLGYEFVYPTYREGYRDAIEASLA
ncbi:SDR family oxidoreductase [Halapricum hydrolyticum]|uniref:SDR family oxidoreductase n=1 Tax=Halapricum hydrolyticum TaxID=2979991 RepID=A0AAE3LFH3_9EURY|nr:SDR family oxidoreductase [Halapricum hydrolyticum]MCU4718559.1 SDR family oxidoreductase [Halapricum hydrolyticum]MCU4727592.1 SDR family oxidoreductase [Halapricum hydrolyticum]